MTKNNLLSEQLNYTGNEATPTHLHLCSYTADKITRYDSQDIQTLIPKMDKEAIHWIQVHGLRNTETIRQVCEYFQIDFLTTQDILNPNLLTKIEEHERYNLVILKLLQIQPSQENEFVPQQLCIIQGENFVLTFTEKETHFFDDIPEALNHNVLKIRNKQSDFLLSVLLNSIMVSFMSIISKMEDELEDLEECFLSANVEKQPSIENIQLFRRNYRLIKKSIFPLKEQISKLFHAENKLLHKGNRPFFSDVNDHLQFIFQTLEGCRDLLDALVDLYLSNNNQRMNGIMKQLTIVSTIFIPLTFLAGVWGMNFQYMPELNWPYGYLLAWCLMITTAIVVVIYMKYKKWD